MTNLPPQPHKRISRNTVIAVALIAIMLIASAAGVILGLSANQSGNSPTPTATASSTASPSPSPTATPTSKPTPTPSPVPYDFNISLDYGSSENTSNTLLPTLTPYTLTQGCTICVATLHVITISGDAKSVNPHDVIICADSGSSGIQSVFNATSYAYGYPDSVLFGESAPAHGFNTNYTIYVPSSMPPNTYPITITVRIGSVSHSISILVLIKPPSATQITVFGTIDVGNSDVTWSQLQFQNLVGGKLYYAALTENATYSIDLPNYSFFSVCIIDNGTAPNGTVRWLTVDHPLTVNVPDGGTSMTKDFTVLG
jgi:hypothetical protein